MIKDLDGFIAHLKRTGRLKLLRQVLCELKETQARARLTAPRRETAEEHPSLVSGWRSIEDGILTDHTGKRALMEIYQQITK